MHARVTVIVDELVSECVLNQLKVLVVLRGDGSPEAALIAVTGVIAVSQDVVDEIGTRLIAGSREIVVTEAFAEVADKLVELGMDRGLSAHNPHDAVEALHRVHGPLERLEVHKEWLHMVPAEARAIGAALRARVGDLDLDDLHVRWRFHRRLPSAAAMAAGCVSRPSARSVLGA